MSAAFDAFLRQAWAVLNGPGAAFDDLTVTQDGALPSRFHVSDLAAASVGVAALAVADLAAALGGTRVPVTVDRRLASFWFGWSIKPDGWTVPAPWDPIAGDYLTRDGWIRLHTNVPHHRDAALRVLETANDRDAVAQAVRSWTAEDLEGAVVAAQGCAAAMRSLAAWAAHPQGKAVAAEKLIRIDLAPSQAAPDWTLSPMRPLAGLRVLDLTRVLAGPVATRFLAGFGADVLRIDPPHWDEPGVVPDVTLGKRCARLDLTQAVDRATFERLVAAADVLVHGYRSDALERLGFGAAWRRATAPALLDVALDAYGWTGPWATRRGFDSLVQMSSGIADAGMQWRNADRPVPLPVQALDHATGYLIAAAVVRAVTLRLAGKGVLQARLSLARTAKLLVDAGFASDQPDFAPQRDADFSAALEQTVWGPARRLAPPVQVANAPMRWTRPASPLGSSAAAWDD